VGLQKLVELEAGFNPKKPLGFRFGDSLVLVLIGGKRL
jgi:hypothetical protein